jgi:Transcriptional regulator
MFIVFHPVAFVNTKCEHLLIFLLTKILYSHTISSGVTNMEKPQKPAKPVRKPVQPRSISTKEKILDAALDLFCEKGYYKTTTNEIAQKAQVSIGSLYSYFKDKDAVFFDVLDKYHEKFEMSKMELLNNRQLFQEDLRAWLRALILNIIKVHEESKELNREITVLSYYNPRVAEITDENRKRTRLATMAFFRTMDEGMSHGDIDAEAIVIFDLFSATVDRIVFGNTGIEPDRLINTAVDIVYTYFKGQA